MYKRMRLVMRKYGTIVKRQNMGTTMRRPGSGRISKITQHVKELMEKQMEKDDESTATQLHRMLNENGFEISLRIVLR